MITEEKINKKMKKLYSKDNGKHLMYHVKVSEAPEGKYINIMDIETDNRTIFCTLFRSSRLAGDNVFWEQPISELKPYEMQNIMEVWNNFDLYFNSLNQ
jgi:hypothetical protein